MKVQYLETYDLDAWGPLAYSHETDAGFDLRVVEDVELEQGDVKVIGCGVKFGIPEGPNHVEIRSRSGLAAKEGVFILNAPGTVDQDYTGEIKLILSKVSKGKSTFTRGARMAQAVLVRHEKAAFEQVMELNAKERGINGFGSTGIN